MRTFLLLTLFVLAGIANAWAGACPSGPLGDPRLFAESEQTASEAESAGESSESQEGAAEEEEEEEEEEPDCE